MGAVINMQAWKAAHRPAPPIALAPVLMYQAWWGFWVPRAPEKK